MAAKIRPKTGLAKLIEEYCDKHADSLTVAVLEGGEWQNKPLSKLLTSDRRLAVSMYGRDWLERGEG